MPIFITDECINCGACAVECPENAIFLVGKPVFFNNLWFSPISTEHYFILPDLCNECSGIEDSKCISVCPMNAIQKNNIDRL